MPGFIRRHGRTWTCIVHLVLAVNGLSAEKVLQMGQEQVNIGNYAKAVELMRPLVHAEATELNPEQERRVGTMLSTCYRFLLDFKAALALSQRLLALAEPHSHARAVALTGVCLDYLGLHAFYEARTAITEAVSILEELGLQQHEDYGAVLMALGDVDREQGRYREALVVQ
jgi:tetratricopeptide (TPR) repeat protein